ncbi:sensor histidine kinase [Streptomyces lonegramiae]|uniref:histidine kinase n=1 Tax=Streptomyces lonegramiae TaxID=3075524 RepID=A0ABU2XPZ4_9ACTN|nr:histidine kinase [Streptomyces sp. DSM 41529]MDT0547981.1 histidine kinase [Streptomyces sp. DSM 41529]
MRWRRPRAGAAGSAGAAGAARAAAGRGAAAVRRLGRAPDLPLVAAAALCAAGLLQAVAEIDERNRADIPLTLALALGSTAPLAFARTHLLPAATAVTAAVLLTPLSDRLPCVAALPALAALLYLTGLRGSPRTTLLFAAPFVAYAVGPAASAAGGKPLGVALLAGAAAALAAGAARRAGGEAAARSAADWEYAHTVLEHAARGERARIARELHDVVAHHISTLSVQAETARLTTPGLPPLGAERLLAIGDTARQALTEMRRLLGVLRDDASSGPPTRRPQPGLDQLLTLVDEARDTAGGGVRLVVRGRIAPLEPGLELTAYRIVQEALTNARRHAPGAPVDVELHYAEGALRVTVRDIGPVTGPMSPGPAPGGGHGLLGMRERVAMAGGTLRTGHGPAGGFVVAAELPLRAAAAA